MKILQLRFKNLNSLVGEWRIDFTNPAYDDSGIFAIVGPTGSGKTTILDAICLALYGQTPRLGKITRGSNELMSRQTAECFAEVIFESSKGRFRCHWSQRRAKKQPRGELQQQQHEIADAVSGKVLESKIKEVLEKVQDCTGMDFSQFTRSILLAQGGFAAFLSASPADRAPILEQITGTAIYSDISRRVHERTSVERAKVSLFRQELDRIRMLPPEELDAVNRENSESEAKSRTLLDSIRGLDHAINRVQRSADLAKELEILEVEHRALSGRKEGSKGDLELLRRAQTARKFDAECQALDSLAKERAHLQEQFESDLDTYESCQEECRGLNDQLAEIDSALAECGNDATLPGRIGEISLLIQSVRGRIRTIDAVHGDLAREEFLLEDAFRKQRGMIETRQRKEKELEREQQSYDRLRADRAATLKNRTLRDWYDCERDATATISEGESLLEMARRTEENRKKADHLEKEVSVLVGRRKKFSLDLDMMQRQIREVDGTIAVLEETCRHLDRIRDLDEERKRLEDGRPCPLCGSPHHPYANGRIPEMNSQEQDLAGWKNKRSELADASISLGKTVVRTEAEIAENRRKQEDLRHEQESLGKTIATGLSRLDLGPDTPDLSPRIELIIGASRQAAEEARLVISAAENQADLIRDHESLLQSVRNDLEQIHRDMAESGAAVGEHESTITRLRTSLEHEESDMERDRSALKEKLSPYSLELTEDRDMEEILNELTDRCKTYRSLVTAREKTAPLVTSSRARLDHLRHQIGNVADRIEERDAAIRTQVDDLTRKVTGCGFADYQAFLDARIGQARFEDLEGLEMEIQNDEIRISALIRSKTDELVKVRDGIEPGVSLGELEESRARLQKELEEVQERLTAIRVVLGQHEEHSRHRNEQLALMDQQRIEADRWERLDQLIGSHDGKKFRTFAQGITFEHLIRNANRHLKNLNNRYILVRTDDGHLDMNVVDMYQAGEVRSTKNLSGGETFIVSLALALGLSDMASNNVRVDSLFLDEGFGTLDSESLDVAIEALIRLQTEGKLIGVISHVPAVKERIPTQIIVEKKAGGISSLSAPGCSFKAG